MTIKPCDYLLLLLVLLFIVPCLELLWLELQMVASTSSQNSRRLDWFSPTTTDAIVSAATAAGDSSPSTCCSDGGSGRKEAAEFLVLARQSAVWVVSGSPAPCWTQSRHCSPADGGGRSLAATHMMWRWGGGGSCGCCQAAWVWIRFPPVLGRSVLGGRSYWAPAGQLASDWPNTHFLFHKFYFNLSLWSMKFI